MCLRQSRCCEFSAANVMGNAIQLKTRDEGTHEDPGMMLLVNSLQHRIEQIGNDKFTVSRARQWSMCARDHVFYAKPLFHPVSFLPAVFSMLFHACRTCCLYALFIMTGGSNRIMSNNIPCVGNETPAIFFLQTATANSNYAWHLQKP